MAILITRVQRLFTCFFISTTSEKLFIPKKPSAAVQALKDCPVRPRVLSQFGQESCPAGEYLHSEWLWMFEKVSAALNTSPTTIPQTPHISKNPQKKKSWGITLLEKLRAADESSKVDTALSSSVHISHSVM